MKKILVVGIIAVILVATGAYIIWKLSDDSYLSDSVSVTKSQLYTACFSGWKPKKNDPENASILREQYCTCIDEKISSNQAIRPATYERLVTKFSVNLNVLVGKETLSSDDPEVQALGEAFTTCLNQILPDNLRGDRERSLSGDTVTPVSEISGSPVFSEDTPTQEIHFSIENLSTVLDPVDIVVVIDGKEVINTVFAYGSPQDIFLKLAEGSHRINISSQKTSAKITNAEFEVKAKKHYATVGYFQSTPNQKNFSFSISE